MTRRRAWPAWLAAAAMAIGPTPAGLAATEKAQQPSSSSTGAPSAPSTSTTSTSSQQQQLADRAKEMIDLAKAKLRDQQREAAQRMAIEMSRQRAKELSAKQREAERQLQLARQRQLKAFYAQALTQYQQGNYQQAIDTVQQMALLNPKDPIVGAGERLATRAETKLLEQQARLLAAGPRGASGAPVPELERLLTEKRIEQETVLKFSRASIKERNYDTAIQLLQRVLAQDPLNRDAQQLMEQAKMAKLDDEGHQLDRQGTIDEKQMLNDVARSELVSPAAFGGRMSSTRVPGPEAEAASVMLSQLRQPVSFDFQEVGFDDVLDFLGDTTHISIVPSPRLDLKEYKVSLKVDKLPLELALKYLVKNLGLDYRIDDLAVRIASPEEFASEPMETRVFFLKSGLGPFTLETAAVKPNTAIEMDGLKDMLEKSIPQPTGSKLVIDERSGSLIATNSKENLHLIEQLLSQLDTTPVQVLIETRFMEVTLTELEQLSLEGVLTGNVALNKKFDHTDTRSPANQIASGSGSTFPSLSRTDEGLNLTLQGVLTGTQFEALLHTLGETQHSKTLSSPRVTALNNQKASIKVVDEFRYPTRYEVSLVQFDINGDGDFEDAGETQFVNVPQDIQKRDVGILLNVTPSVGRDLKNITLVLAPEVSQFSQFRDLGGGVTVPEFTTSQLTTSVAMQDGQTVVLGGLMRDSVSETNTKVPVLGDIPVMGNLFRQHQTQQTRRNLLIFVTARVLAPRGPTI